MHKEAIEFMRWCRAHFSKFYSNVRVLDVGSGDINGNNRYLFDLLCEYNGNDVHAAPNVTIVSKTKDLQFTDEYFDTIISSECFEHDPEYVQSLQKIVRMLKPGGLFAFTCASTDRPEHGTRRSKPNDSFGTIAGLEGWIDYYKNLTIEDVDTAINIHEVFSDYASFYNSDSKDLYFWGIKKSENDLVYNIPSYVVPGIVDTSCNILTVSGKDVIPTKSVDNVKVLYGTHDHSIDVTSTFLKHFYRDGTITIPKYTHFNSLFGDPVPFVKKHLDIRCRNETYRLMENLEQDFVYKH